MIVGTRVWIAASRLGPGMFRYVCEKVLSLVLNKDLDCRQQKNLIKLPNWKADYTVNNLIVTCFIRTFDCSFVNGIHDKLLPQVFLNFLLESFL